MWHRERIEQDFSNMEDIAGAIFYKSVWQYVVYYEAKASNEETTEGYNLSLK